MSPRTKRSDEAYLLIDHRNSPGITPEFLAKNNLEQLPIGAGEVMESAMVVCHSCGADVILNPKRTREREWCMKHDAYLCDRCALRRRLTGSCEPLWAQIEKIFRRLTSA